MNERIEYMTDDEKQDLIRQVYEDEGQKSYRSIVYSVLETITTIHSAQEHCLAPQGTLESYSSAVKKASIISLQLDGSESRLGIMVFEQNFAKSTTRYDSSGHAMHLATLTAQELKLDSLVVVLPEYCNELPNLAIFRSSALKMGVCAIVVPQNIRGELKALFEVIDTRSNADQSIGLRTNFYLIPVDKETKYKEALYKAVNTGIALASFTED